MNIEKEKTFYEMVKMNDIEKAMGIFADSAYHGEEYSRMCELGAIASAVGKPGIGGACFFIDLLDVEKHHDKYLNLLKVFVKANSVRMVSYLIGKGMNPFVEFEGETVLKYTTNEEILDVISEQYEGITSEETSILEAYRINLYITA